MAEPERPTYDLDALEAATRACVHGDPWYTAEQVGDGIRLPKDHAFVAALSPAVALDLIRRVRDAEAGGTRMLQTINEMMDGCPFCDLPDEQHDPGCACGYLDDALRGAT